jgi:hypothetical protein
MPELRAFTLTKMVVRDDRSAMLQTKARRPRRESRPA